MGEMADYDYDQGELLLLLHQTGQCGEVGPCPYCELEEEEIEAAEAAGGG